MNIQRDEIFLPIRVFTVSSKIYRPQQGPTEKTQLVPDQADRSWSGKMKKLRTSRTENDFQNSDQDQENF